MIICSGILTIFNPASTTYVKHFTANHNIFDNGNYAVQYVFLAGYGNTTSAINAVHFKCLVANR
jgi:hypothetical protein